LGRSRPAGRRPVSRRAAAPDVATPASGVRLAPGPSLASATLPRVWQGTGFRPLPDADPARRLFDFAAVPWPETFIVAGAASPDSTVGGLPKQGPGSVVAGAASPDSTVGGLPKQGPGSVVAGAARPDSTVGGLPKEGPGSVAFCWGAHVAAATGERLVGAIVAERSERAVMLHGPVVAVEAPMVGGENPVVGSEIPVVGSEIPVVGSEIVDALEVAAQLVAAALDHAAALGIETVFARPQGLDRIWIRYGFIPVPEGALPAALGGRQGAGLYAWRGGTALWTFRERPQHDH
jgi:hypothetical protein